MACSCTNVSAQPHFLAVNFKHPWVLTRENNSTHYVPTYAHSFMAIANTVYLYAFPFYLDFVIPQLDTGVFALVPGGELQLV